jgi:hypothetical protein
MAWDYETLMALQTPGGNCLCPAGMTIFPLASSVPDTRTLMKHRDQLKAGRLGISYLVLAFLWASLLAHVSY